jgi:hypothetical protein
VSETNRFFRKHIFLIIFFSPPPKETAQKSFIANGFHRLRAENSIGIADIHRRSIHCGRIRGNKILNALTGDVTMKKMVHDRHRTFLGPMRDIPTPIHKK